MTIIKMKRSDDRNFATRGVSRIEIVKETHLRGCIRKTIKRSKPLCPKEPLNESTTPSEAWGLDSLSLRARPQHKENHQSNMHTGASLTAPKNCKNSLPRSGSLLHRLRGYCRVSILGIPSGRESRAVSHLTA
jgi:hypothetical protein